MVELFKNPKVDWIGARKYFVGLTLVLLSLGSISVLKRGFNLGVDFAGGTIMTVRFEQRPSLEAVRSALAAAGIDTTKVTLQSDIARPQELLIRAPQLGSGTEAERRVDEEKRTITRALQRLNPGDTSGGKLNINLLDVDSIEQELRRADPLGIRNQQFSGAHPYRQVAEQVISLRDGQHTGFLQDIGQVRQMNLSAPNFQGFDQEKVKSAILNIFYAGKIDLNLASAGEIQSALERIDPLSIRGQTNFSEVYRKAADAISRYRKDRHGVIGDLKEIQIEGVSADLLSKMEPYFMTGNWAIISADIVGPQVGEDLRRRAIYVVLSALAGMLIYIAFRFEWIYGVSAVIAVFHDVMITLGFFSLFRWEISLTVVAALLTLIGYSVNDTIVVFDRIRENLRLRRRDSFVQITNDSINQTLSRTIITSGLTFISVLAIVLFGGEVLEGFGWALTIGILVGTYSSIAVASPIMLWWHYLTSSRGAGRRAPGLAKV
jgi:preprotein translocase SecF subunit